MVQNINALSLEKALQKTEQEERQQAELEHIRAVQEEMAKHRWPQLYHDLFKIAFKEVLRETLGVKPWQKKPSDKDPRDATQFTHDWAARTARIAHVYAYRAVEHQMTVAESAAAEHAAEEAALAAAAANGGTPPDPMAQGGVRPTVNDTDLGAE